MFDFSLNTPEQLLFAVSMTEMINNMVYFVLGFVFAYFYFNS